MIAARLTAPHQLEIAQIDDPTPRPGDALIRVHAAAITRDELTWPLDRLPAIPSYEISGTVSALGSDATGLAVDQEVFALTPFDRDGGAAEYAVVPSAIVASKPKMLDHVHSAAIPLAGLTAWQALFDHGGLQRGERVIVTGAHGGVGHFAVQLARWAGAEVINEGAADLAFDTIGPAALTGIRAGRIVSVAKDAPGVTFFIVSPNRDQLVELARLADEGTIRPEIDSVFPLANARAAFDRVAERGKRGKVVLRVGSGLTA
jgi:NADPH:quinone reductase-like Zn-dependent oxidoreductase